MIIGAALFSAALLLRTIDLTDAPPGFFTDEASFGLNAHLILTSGKDEHGEFMPLLFRSFGEYKLPVFVYAQIPVQAVLGMNEFSVRFTSALLGSFTVVSVYLLIREILKGKVPAIAAAGFVAILPWHVHISRTGLGDVVALPLFLTVALYLFLRAIRTQTSFLPSAIMFGLTFYSYRAGWVIVPPLLLILAITYRRELWQKRREALVSVATIGVMLAPIASHLLWGDGDRTSQVSIFTLDTDRSRLAVFWDLYRPLYEYSVLFKDGPLKDAVTRHYLPGHGLLYAFMAPLIIAGLIGLILRFGREHVVLLALFILFPIGGALSGDGPSATRTGLGSVVFPMVAAAGVGFLADLLWRLRTPAGSVAVSTGLILLVIVAGYRFLHYQDRYFNDYPALSAGYWGWQDGPEEILGLFNERQDNYDELWMDGAFNAPAIFIPFYLGESCPKCHIGSFERFNIERRQLFAVRSENQDLGKWNYEVKQTLYYPDGKPSFYLVELVGRR